MKNRNSKTSNQQNSNFPCLANLPGYAIGSKKAKESKIIKCRAIVFEKQMSDNFEIIF